MARSRFTPREIDDQSGIGTQFVVADFNGDGLLDIVDRQQERRVRVRANARGEVSDQSSGRRKTSRSRRRQTSEGCGRNSGEFRYGYDITSCSTKAPLAVMSLMAGYWAISISWFERVSKPAGVIR